MPILGDTVPGLPNENQWTFSNVKQNTADVINMLSIGSYTPAATIWEVSFYGGGFGIDVPTVVNFGANHGTITGLKPGTIYRVRWRAKNSLGFGPYSQWKAFITLAGVSVKVGEVWKAADPYINVAGVWKPATRYINVAGTWKQ